MSLFKSSYKKFFSFNNKLKKNSKVILINKPSSFITSFFIGKTVSVYNGKEFVTFLVEKDMESFRFGEFILTRKPFKAPKKKAN